MLRSSLGSTDPATMTDLPMAVDRSFHTVTQFTFSDRNTDSKLVLMCNGKRLVIRLSAGLFDELPQLKEQYL